MPAKRSALLSGLLLLASASPAALAQLSVAPLASAKQIGPAGGPEPAAVAAVMLTHDPDEYQSLAPSTRLTRFEELPLGPVKSLRLATVRIEHLSGPGLSGFPEIVDSVVGLGASFWFGSDAVGQRFVLANTSSMLFSFRTDHLGFGFSANCLACDPVGSPSRWTITLYDRHGVQVGVVDQERAMTGAVDFYGIVSSEPFRFAVLTRSSGGNWLFDDLLQSDLPSALVPLQIHIRP